MIIEEAFYIKFTELFPGIPLHAILVTSNVTGLNAAYHVLNRGAEFDLFNKSFMHSITIQVNIMSLDFIEVSKATWQIIEGFELALDTYAAGAPCVQQTIITSDADGYDFDLATYQSHVQIQIFFN